MARSGRIKKTGYFDYGMVFVIVLLLAFGMVMLYSTSSYTASLRLGDSAYFVKRQAVFSIIGLGAMYVVSRIDYHFWARIAFMLYIGSILLVAYALVAGTSLNNSSRWIYIGPVSIQPSEIAKVAVIVFFSTLFTKAGPKLGDIRMMGKMAVFAIFISAVVAISNLSTAVIIFGIFYVMLFIASKQTRIMLLIAGLVVMLVVVTLPFVSYRAMRIMIWKHPEQYEKGYQTLQGLYAIGSGGIFGKGLGESMQKQFVPEAQNDMIFSIICEELGLFGAISIIVLFMILTWRFMVIAMNARDLYSSLLVVGVMTHIAVQVILNIAVVTNTIPNTGISLPFISFGGSSVLFLLIEVGVVLRVMRDIRQES